MILRSSRPYAVFLLFLLLSAFTYGQAPKKYFDKNGKSSSPEQGYYYRQLTGNNVYKSFYVSNDAVYFEGAILNANDTDESANMYTGECTWYYRNGQKKAVRIFNDKGRENGVSTYYYETGRLQKEIAFTNGIPDPSKVFEYSEDGSKTKIFEEKFDNNANDWDLYESDKTGAVITDGMMELTSYNDIGASRFLSMSRTSDEFAFEGRINTQNTGSGQKAGLIYGFKDWDNYNYFLISGQYFYIGSVFEGVNTYNAEGMYGTSIVEKGLNLLKVITDGSKIIFSVNGEVQYSLKNFTSFGSNFGFAISGKGSFIIEEMIFKEFGAGSGVYEKSGSDKDIRSSGSGVVISTDGYIVTNHHVVDNANQVLVELKAGDVTKTYKAQVAQVDKENDLAIIKINDVDFVPFAGIQYSFKESGALDVGSGVFTLGFPLALSGMGKDVKFTDGKISSKTGFNNSVNSYQTSIPVQPGNSGGPLFSESGELVGVINAKIMQADNVSYAIKLNYIKNLIDLLPSPPKLPADAAIKNLSLEEKIKTLSSYVVLVKIK